LEKAKDNKKKADLVDNYNQGKKKKPCNPIKSNYLMIVADAVGIELGECEIELQNNLVICSDFEKCRKGDHTGNPVGVDCGEGSKIEKNRIVVSETQDDNNDNKKGVSEDMCQKPNKTRLGRDSQGKHPGNKSDQ
jgi:hypothetical protein